MTDSTDAVDIGVEGITESVPHGHGGSATVYRAREADLDRVVAVKVIHNVSDPAVLTRFERERRALGRLSDHPGIVTIYRAGLTARGEPFLVLPFCHNGSLTELTARRGPLPWREACSIMASVSRTVQHAHDNKILHRDLKPGNILLAEDGSPLVSDFGVAKLTGGAATAQSTVLSMTPAFSPPEVFDAIEPAPPSDVYSLGATLFALVAGHPPFASDSKNPSLLALMRKVIDEPVPDLRDVAPEQVCVAIETAMSKDPDGRPQTAAEFAQILDATIEDDATTVAVRRPPPHLESQTPAAAEVAPPAEPESVEQEPGALAPAPGREPPSKLRRNVFAAALVAVLAAAGIGVGLLIGGGEGDVEATPQVTPTAEPTVEVVAADPPTPLPTVRASAAQLLAVLAVDDAEVAAPLATEDGQPALETLAGDSRVDSYVVWNCVADSCRLSPELRLNFVAGDDGFLLDSVDRGGAIPNSFCAAGGQSVDLRLEPGPRSAFLATIPGNRCNMYDYSSTGEVIEPSTDGAIWRLVWWEDRIGFVRDDLVVLSSS